MLDFHYNTIEAKLKGKYDLIYSDTDSLVYHIKIQNLNKWFLDNEEEFDLSEMEKKHRSEKNTNVLGKFKSEVGSKIITEFVALSPKSYCYKYCSQEVKKAKGVSLAISEKNDGLCRLQTSYGFEPIPNKNHLWHTQFQPAALHNLRRQNCFNEFLRQA